MAVLMARLGYDRLDWLGLAVGEREMEMRWIRRRIRKD